MNNKSEAPTVGAVEAGDTEQRSNQQAPPCQDSIIPSRQMRNPRNAEIGKTILPLLRHGRDKAQKRRELLALTGLRDRDFRHGIEALRRGGTVVCSDERGYYLPATVGEILDFIAQEERRARSTFFTLRPARELAARLQAQGEQTEIKGV